MKASWKTSLCGILGLLFVGLSQISEFPVLWLKVFALLGALAPNVGNLFARDSGVTSEQARAKSGGVPVAITRVSVALLLGLLIGQAVVGCASPYKAAGVVVVTVDRAADAWCDYVVATKALPGYDAEKLEKQEREVRRVYAQYQAAMDAVYFARLAANANQTGAGLDSVLASSRQASDALVRLIVSFLPSERVATLKLE